MWMIRRPGVGQEQVINLIKQDRSAVRHDVFDVSGQNALSASDQPGTWRHVLV